MSNVGALVMSLCSSAHGRDSICRFDATFVPLVPPVLQGHAHLFLILLILVD